MNKDSHVRVREVKAEDLESIVALFKETIHHVNAKDYTPEQLLTWAPHQIHHHDERWQSMLNNIAYLAEINGIVVGFADMTVEGYLDRLFVHKDYQGRYISLMLLNKLKSVALEKGIKKITAEVSITAKHLAERLGMYVIKEQNKVCPGGVTLTNFLMEKRLDGSTDLDPKEQEKNPGKDSPGFRLRRRFLIAA